MTALVLTLVCASGHSFGTYFWEAKQANVVLSSCLRPSALLFCLPVRPCGELDSETQLTTNPVKELKKRTEHIFNSAEVNQFICSPAKSGNGTTEEPPLE